MGSPRVAGSKTGLRQGNLDGPDLPEKAGLTLRPKPMRINKFLAACGLGSRRKVEEIVRAGRVRVNGAPVLDLSTFVEPDRDRVQVDGKPVALPGQFTYYLLHKPE